MKLNMEDIFEDPRDRRIYELENRLSIMGEVHDLIKENYDLCLILLKSYEKENKQLRETNWKLKRCLFRPN